MVRLPLFLRIIYGLLIVAYFANLAAGQSSSLTVKDLNGYITGGKDLSCYVCNSALEKCDLNDTHVKVNCKTGYFPHIYGNDSLGDESMLLRKWPKSLSEIAAGGETEAGGWVAGSFPSSYTVGKGLVGGSGAVRFSPLVNAASAPAGPGSTLQLKGGFQSCRTVRITASSQLNGGKRGEIPIEKPRIIRSCSFIKVEDKTSKDLFDSNACRLINYKTSLVEVCYCDENFCNASPYLGGSLRMLALSFFLIFAAII